jgi:NagD protein
MDTDIRAGLEAGMQTILVLSGISADTTAEMYPFRPTRVINSIADLVGNSANPF